MIGIARGKSNDMRPTAWKKERTTYYCACSSASNVALSLSSSSGQLAAKHQAITTLIEKVHTKRRVLVHNCEIRGDDEMILYNVNSRNTRP